MISHHLPAWGVCGQKARTLSLFFPFKVMHVPGLPLESEVGVWNQGTVQGVDADKMRLVRLAGPHVGAELGVRYLSRSGAVTWKVWEPQSAM